MNRNIRMAAHYPGAGGRKIYFSTELEMTGRDIIEFYRTRFQIEFCFRVSGQFASLNHCQARALRMPDLAFDASLASVSIAKVIRSEHCPTPSIGLPKSHLANIYMLRRFFARPCLRPNRALNAKLVNELFGLVVDAA